MRAGPWHCTPARTGAGSPRGARSRTAATGESSIATSIAPFITERYPFGVQLLMEGVEPQGHGETRSQRPLCARHDRQDRAHVATTGHRAVAARVLSDRGGLLPRRRCDV